MMEKQRKKFNICLRNQRTALHKLQTGPWISHHSWFVCVGLIDASASSLNSQEVLRFETVCGQFLITTSSGSLKNIGLKRTISSGYLKNIGLKRTASSGYLKPSRIKWVLGIWNPLESNEPAILGIWNTSESKNHQFRVSKHLWNWRIASSRQSKKNNRIKKTIGPNYFKNIKEPPCFMKELIIFWAVIWLFQKLRTRVIYQELGNVVFDNHGYISELDRVCFEITMGLFYFFFSLPRFRHFLTKKLDFFDSVNSSNFAKVWLNLILLKGEKKHWSHLPNLRTTLIPDKGFGSISDNCPTLGSNFKLQSVCLPFPYDRKYKVFENVETLLLTFCKEN